MLAGVLDRIDNRDRIQGRQLAGIHAPDIGKAGSQRRSTEWPCRKKLRVPVMFLRTGKRAHIEKIAARCVVDAVVAHPIFVIDVRKRDAGGSFHHLHACPVIGIPVRVVGHLLNVGTGCTCAVGAGRSLRRGARIGIAIDSRRDDCKKCCPRHVAAREGSWRGRATGDNRSRRRCRRRRDGHHVGGTGSTEADTSAGTRRSQRASVDLRCDVGRNVSTGSSCRAGGKDLDTIYRNAGDGSRSADRNGRSPLTGNAGVGIVGDSRRWLDIARDTGGASIRGGIQCLSGSCTPTQRCGESIGPGWSRGCSTGTKVCRRAVLAGNGGVGIGGPFQVRGQRRLDAIAIHFDGTPVSRSGSSGGITARGRTRAIHAGIGRSFERTSAVKHGRRPITGCRVVGNAVVRGIEETVCGSDRGENTSNKLLVGARPVRRKIPVHAARVIENEHDIGQGIDLAVRGEGLGRKLGRRSVYICHRKRSSKDRPQGTQSTTSGKRFMGFHGVLPVNHLVTIACT